MNSDSHGSANASAGAERPRDRWRRDFVRANTAVAVVLVAVLSLAILAIVFGYRAARQRARAEHAEQTAHERLHQSYLAQARAERLSIRAGHRRDALTAISNAAVLRPTLELRNEALASLALADLETELTWPFGRTGYSSGYSFDPALEHYSVSEAVGEISIYRLSDNTLVKTLRRQDAGLDRKVGFAGLLFSNTGKFALALGDDGTLIVWDWRSGQPLLPFGRGGPGRGSGWPPSFSANDQWMAMVSSQHRGKVVLVNLTSGEMRLPPVPESPRQLSILSPRGDTLAVATGQEVRLHEADSGAFLRSFAAATEVHSLAWDASGQQLAAACRDANVYVWNLEKGVPRTLTGHSESPWNLHFSPDGALLASASTDGSSRLWDVESGRTICRKTDAHIAKIGNGRVACGRAGVGVQLARLTAGPGYQVLRGRAAESPTVENQDLSPDGRWLTWAWPSTTRPGGFSLWDLKLGGPPVSIFTGGSCNLALHPCESALFLVDSNGLVLHRMEENPNPSSGGRQVELHSPTPIPLPSGFQPFQCAVDADGQTLAIIGRDGRLAVLHRTEPERVTFLAGRAVLDDTGPASPTGSGRIAVSAQGGMVAVANLRTNRNVHVWDARTGKLLRRLPVRDATLAFSPDGRWLATGDHRTYTLWSTQDWKRHWHKSRVGVLFSRGAVAFARDGQIMAIARSHDEVQLIDTLQGRDLATLAAPDPLPVAGLRLSADGQVLAAAGPDGQIQFWNLAELRRGLARLNLDWDQSLAGTAAVSPRNNPGAAWTSPGAVVLFGLLGVTMATFFAIVVLRRHRGLVLQFVQSEAIIDQRNRELEVARVDLMHSQKMKALGTLAAGIAHDFNNLLSVIRMSNKLIGRASQNHPDVAEEVASIEEAVQQGKQIVGSMLGYSRDQAAGNHRCDLGEMIEETVSLLTREFLSGIELTLALEQNVAPVDIGRGHLDQILLNLLVNAAEAMKHEGKLRIGLGARSPEPGDEFVLRPRPAARYVELAVADSGPGIAGDVLPRIFEPFFTTKTTGLRQGTGLGLSMVYTIAEQDGLGLMVRTEPGRGTTFLVWIPCAPEAQFPESNEPGK